MPDPISPEQQAQGLGVVAKLDTLTHEMGQSNSPEARQITSDARDKALSAVMGEPVTINEKPDASLNLTPEQQTRIDEIRAKLASKS